MASSNIKPNSNTRLSALTPVLDLHVVHRWDDEALQQLYTHFYKALVAFAVQMVNSQTVAEELVQDAFTLLWQRRNTFKNSGALKAYLFNTVRNRSISYLRHQQVERSRIAAFEQEYQLIDNGAGEQSDYLSREEIYRQLLLAIDQLPPRQRQLFLLSIEGKSSDEIAQEMGISPEAVKKQRQRGLSRLRQRLSPHAYLMLLCLM